MVELLRGLVRDLPLHACPSAVGFLFLVAKAIELAIACCYRKPSDPAHGACLLCTTGAELPPRMLCCCSSASASFCTDIFGLSADSTFKRSGAAAEESQPLAADHVA